MVEMHFVFEGAVQGVNFRKTVANIASVLLLTGFVKNQLDGSVFLLAQGNKNDILQLVEVLRDKFKITNIHQVQKLATKIYKAFSIKR